ncbi:hypothetical protein F4677DRAFT_462966 [Hypoxylon crocopeplum]|nr:hypothetical protein F4677DRAFT_462966 [Hypoxylon crocopeplum]
MVRTRNWHRARGANVPTPVYGQDPAHPRATGWVSTDGKFLCYCGSITGNTSKDIGSHLTKLHKHDSAYQMAQFREHGFTWDCEDCDAKHECFNALVTHSRRCEGFRGSSDGMRSRQDPFKPSSSLEDTFQLRAHQMMSNFYQHQHQLRQQHRQRQLRQQHRQRQLRRRRQQRRLRYQRQQQLNAANDQRQPNTDGA